MNIYTKTGDKGETSLFGGTRVGKDNIRLRCYGTVDETNSFLGLVYSKLEFENLRAVVRTIQEKLFIVGAELASDEKGLEKLKVRIGDQDITFLENIIDDWTARFGKTTHFSIPGETEVSALFHVVRSIIRRAEVHIVEASKDIPISQTLRKYINRLSDAFFVMAKLEVYQTFEKKVVEKISQYTNGGGAKVENNILLDGSICESLCRAASQESIKINCPVSIAIADKGGNLIFFFRLPGAPLVSIPVAQNKAYTAVAMKQATGGVRKEALPDGSLFGINTADPRIVVFGGGFPLLVGGEVIGGIGISGGTVEEDEQIAAQALKEFDKCIKSK